jgi:hypothetical protein
VAAEAAPAAPNGGSRFVGEIKLLLTVIGSARSHLASAAMTGSVRTGAGTW